MGRESGSQLTELLPLERRLIRPVRAARAIINTWPPVAIGFLTFDGGRITDAVEVATLAALTAFCWEREGD